MIYLAGPYTANMIDDQCFNLGRLYTYFLHLQITKPTTPILCYPLQTKFMERVQSISPENYLNICINFIRSVPCQVVFVPQWEYSHGCTIEREEANKHNRIVADLFRYYLNESLLSTELMRLPQHSPIVQYALTYLRSDRP